MKRFEGEDGVYELTREEPIALGRLSIFLAARSLRTNGEVLIKAFRDNADQSGSLVSVNREIKALRALKHPHILEIIDFNLGQHEGGTPFLVLPWCRGGDLEQYRRGVDFLPLDRAILMLRQIASAIDHAHAHGVIHGDIKPGNILFSETGDTAYLSDFGLAKYFDFTDRVRVSEERRPSGDRAATFQGGTSAFLSPEQLLDNVQKTESDIYSFGLVAYELLTGRLPFDVHQPLYRQLHARVSGKLLDPLEANRNLSPAACAALNSALAARPGDRPASATSFCDMLMGAPAKTPKPAGLGDSRGLVAAWKELEPTGRAGVIVAIVGAVATTIGALVAVLPKFFGKP